jgi:predicted DNA-binding transcriptional regulator YafY
LVGIPYSNPTEPIMDIQRHGSGVEVLSPASLRKHLGKEIAEMAKRYAR